VRSIAILNQKGGSGKTTTSVSLAAALGEAGQRVLLVDVDPQATATHWLGIKNPGRGITDVFINQRPLVELVRPTKIPGVAMVPASAWLNGAEKAMAWEKGAVKVFKNSMATLPKGQFDYMLVDCPPALGVLVANTLIGVREVLIPVEAHHLALPGVDRVIAAVETLRRHLNPSLRIALIVPCRVDARTRHSSEIVQILRSRFGSLVSKVEIRENVRLAEAPSKGLPITTYDTSSAGAADYRALARELVAKEAVSTS
jgi:chromosome partitioning protein